MLKSALAVFAFLGCGCLNAQKLLFSTFGPGHSFSSFPGLNIGSGEFWNLTGNNGSVLAVSFTSQVSIPFLRADFALNYATVPDRDLTGPADVDVTLAADSDGFPGTVIETLHLTNILGRATTAGVVSANSNLHPILHAGTRYWLVLAPPDLLHTDIAFLGGLVGAPNVLTRGQFLGRVTGLEPQWSGGSVPTGTSLAFAVFGGSDTQPAPPLVSGNGIASAASFAAPVSSGSWISIFGSNLSTTSRGWRADDFDGAVLPTSLDGVSVLLNGKLASISFVSPGQINAQLPDIDSWISISALTLQVITPQGVSVPVELPLADKSPTLFTFTQSAITYAIALHADGTQVTPTQPGIPGEIIALYGTGFGPSTPATPAGTLVTTPAPIQIPYVLIGGTPAQVQYAGIVEAGLDQINVVVPQLPAGIQPVFVGQDGVQLPIGLLPL